MVSANDILKVFEPRRSTQPTDSISGIVEWMNSECANKDSYGIGWEISEGLKIEKVKGVWHWRYAERGEARTIETFRSETGIASYAYEQIRNDPWAWTHCVGWFKIEFDARTFTSSLEERGIPFYSDQIPYGGFDDVRYRVFVFGRDILGLKKIDPIYCT